VVLAQLPTAQDLAGIALVILGIALHQQQDSETAQERTLA
jgi:hypothetical protein